MSEIVRKNVEALWSKPGGVSFRAFMDACLYGVDGYYMRHQKKTGPGSDADFATSPTLHPFFGEAIGNELTAWWEELGRPEPYIICEFGGGEGDIARHANLQMPHEWRNVEISPHHQSLQGTQTDSAAGAHVVLAHEFLDALPFRWMRCNPSWQEAFIENGEVTWKEQNGPFPAIPDLEYAWMDGIQTWLQSLPPCRVLVVDYGGKFHELPHKNVVRTYKNHEHADPLADPGACDITASVDFTRLATLAKELQYETQESFLIRNGIFEAIQNHPQQTLEDMSQFMRLKQLLNPATFGAFKVASYQIG